MSSVEARALAEQIAIAQRKMLEDYRRYHNVKPEEALAQIDEPPHPATIRDALQGEPQQLTWWDFGEVARADPEKALERWEQIQQAARAELESGHRAGAAVEDGSDRPWVRAQFLAIRTSLIEQWRPQGGTELLLIDTMVQAYTEQHRWIAAANNFLSRESDNHRRELEAKEKWLPPRVTAAEALERAMSMAERWNRIFLRTLRALRDLRRYAPTVMIQNAGQVNIGGQQVNVADQTGKM